MALTKTIHFLIENDLAFRVCRFPQKINKGFSVIDNREKIPIKVENHWKLLIFHSGFPIFYGLNNRKARIPIFIQIFMIIFWNSNTPFRNCSQKGIPIHKINFYDKMEIVENFKFHWQIVKIIRNVNHISKFEEKVCTMK